jgi:protein required for attachment to host cells
VRIEKLDEHIKALATLKPSEAPVISCYLDVRSGPPRYRKVVDERVHWLRKSLPGKDLAAFEQALAKIEEFLLTGVAILTRGVAVFARGGGQPFFLALQFEVPLADWIAADLTPNIYHLVELRDNYDRYAILLVTETSARIIGINLGSVTDQVWNTRPELRHRAGNEWTREHFQDHRRERTNRFVHEQVRTLARVMAAGGYGHLILAGNSRALASVRKALPKSLAAKLVDVVPASANDRVSEVVAATLESFLEHEELDSQAIAERLVSQIQTHGLAVAGTHACLRALKTGQVDVLVISKDFHPGSGWECGRCGRIDTQPVRPDACAECRNRHLREFEIRGELVRLAGQLGCGIEVVEHCDALMNLGGVGCLLRFLAPERYAAEAA